MRKLRMRLLGLALACGCALAGRAQAPAVPTTLPQVLAALDRAAPGIESVAATAQVDDYTALVQDTSTSQGKLYFRHDDHGPMYVLDLTTPQASARKLLYRDKTAYVYTPSAKQVMEYALGKQQPLVNQFLLLGMGATGEELQKSFRIELQPPETVGGVTMVHLRLTPLDAQLAGKLTHLDLWYDPHTWVAMVQQMWQPGGDYHRLTLSSVKLNSKLNDKLFSTDFHGATVVKPGQ
ncbi:MAG TPA: hypothetical protein VFP94_08100 [Terriglobales bacterium]|nr:hypothetical protein [Terriglobales bacterium]